ncbi:MAG: response regulator transcription factor [Ardenticatenaceae bacterium]|nr:response regulator transcription factor [Anaerolineales bacterium]MCB8919070.1 response regulator transcription factor [Ardenticatenaceae bacterium]
MASETILVVDDEANIRELASMYLQREGYQVLTARDGEEALLVLRQESPALMILDLMLPKLNGWEVCRRVRADSNIPIIMLTARDEDVDKIVGLEMGADDYMTKPFNPRVLVAQVRAILRRANTAPGRVANTLRQVGNVTIDPSGREVTANNQRIDLRTKEFDLLLALADHPNIVLSRDQLLDIVWGYEFYGQTRTVDVHIAHLRDKLSDSDLVIETVWGKGYKLVVSA